MGGYVYLYLSISYVALYLIVSLLLVIGYHYTRVYGFILTAGGEGAPSEIWGYLEVVIIHCVYGVL